MKQKLTRPTKQEIRDNTSKENKEDLDFIANTVCNLTGVNSLDESSTGPEVRSRWIYYYLCSKHTMLSREVVSAHVDRNHATMTHGLSMVTNYSYFTEPWQVKLADATKICLEYFEKKNKIDIDKMVRDKNQVSYRQYKLKFFNERNKAYKCRQEIKRLKKILEDNGCEY